MARALGKRIIQLGLAVIAGIFCVGCSPSNTPLQYNLAPVGAEPAGGAHAGDGNNGNYSFYGADLDGNEIENVGFDPDAVGVPDEFFFRVTDADNRSAKFAIFHPTCITDPDVEEHYSFVLASASDSSLTMLGLTVTAGNAKFAVPSFQISTGVSTFANRGVSLTNLQTFCEYGRRKHAFGTMYSNGKVAVLIDPEHRVYLGINSELVARPLNVVPVNQFIYTHNSFADSCDFTDCVAPVASFGGSFRQQYSNFDLLSSAYSDASPYPKANDDAQIFEATFDLFQNRAINPYAYKVLKENAASTAPENAMAAVAGVIRGRQLVLGARGTPSGAAYPTRLGSNGFLFKFGYPL